MALLTGWTGKSGYTGPDNKVDYEPEYSVVINVSTAAPAGVWYNVIDTATVARYAFVGMDKATAVLCAAAFHAPASGVNARCVLASGGAMYNVEIDKYIVVTTWEPIEP